MAAYRSDDYNLTGMGEAERVPASQVSADFFSVLGEVPILGRAIRAEDDTVREQRLWWCSVRVLEEEIRRRAGCVGRTLMFNGIGHTVIGVVPTISKSSTTAKYSCRSVWPNGAIPPFGIAPAAWAWKCGAVAAGCDGGAGARGYGFGGERAGHRVSELKCRHGHQH